MVKLKHGRPQTGGSPYAARKTGEYPRLEKLMRSCRTRHELTCLIIVEAAAINALPESWRRSLMDERDRILRGFMR